MFEPYVFSSFLDALVVLGTRSVVFHRVKDWMGNFFRMNISALEVPHTVLRGATAAGAQSHQQEAI